MKTKPMTCRKALEHVCDNLDSDLNSSKCREIRRHLESCPDCHAYLDSLKKTVALYRLYPVPPVPEKAGKKLRLLVRLKK